MGICVLGPLDIPGTATRLGSRDRVVLAALAMRPGRALSADELADAVWGETPPASWRKNLQSCVVRLRKLLGTDAILTAAGGYRLALPSTEIDAAEFEHSVARGRELLLLGEAERAAYVVSQGLALWRGRALPDLEEWQRGRIEAERLEELRLEAEELWLDAALKAGHHQRVLAAAQAMVKAAALRERRWLLLALAEYQSGRQSDALRTLRGLRRMMTDELGLDPGPEVDALEGSILRQDPALAVASSTAASTERCPYLGLASYDVEDADAFFGRDRDVAACLDRLRRAGAVAVVGPSGSGKSSLVRAGVVAALRREGRTVDVITPGRRPTDAWPPHRASWQPSILVVDQCEEVFSLVDDPMIREEFLGRLVDHAATAEVVVALRADRTGDLAAHPGFARLVENGLFLLAAMGAEDLRAAIEQPARQAGLMLEPGLVDLLLREVEGEPGALPLLSHSLRETWLRREGRTLTVAGYRASGGVRGAVAQTAEDVYRRVEPGRRGLLREVLLRLVAPGPEGEAVRSRVPDRQVITDPGQNSLLDMLVASRLVTSDDGVLELAHEAVVSAWPRLRGWLDDDLEGQRILHHLAAAADAWDQLGRPPSELYRGVRLQQALEWRDRVLPELTGVERSFLAAGEELDRAEEQSAVRQARQQAQMIRRLRGVLVGGAALLLLAIAAGVFAVSQSREADVSASAASAAETEAVARRAGANAVVAGDIEQSMLLAVAGVTLDDSAETRNSLLEVINRRPQVVSSTPMVGSGQVLQLEASPDGHAVATLDDHHHVRLYAAGSGELLAERQVGAVRTENSQTERRLAFSPDGRTLAVAGTPLVGRPVAILDGSTLQPVEHPLGGQPTRGWTAVALAFSGDGRHLAAALVKLHAADMQMEPLAARVLVWDLRKRAEPRQLALTGLSWQSIALSHHGDVLFTATYSEHGPTFARHDLSTGSTRDLPGWPFSLVSGVDGRIMVGIASPRIDIFDGRTGRLRDTVRSDAADVRLSRDGTTLAAIDDHRNVSIYDLTAEPPVRRLELHLDRGTPGSVDFSADGSALFAASGGSSLRRWDLTGGRQFLARQQYPDPPSQDFGFAMAAPGGQHAIYLVDNGFNVHDLRTGEVTRTMPLGPGYRHTAGAFHPDGSRFASAVAGTIRVWDMDRAKLLTSVDVGAPEITELDWTPDGSRMVVSEPSGRILMLDGETLSPVGRPVEVGTPVSFVSAGPDDRTAVALTGGPAAEAPFYWRQPSTGWALVDLVEGQVIEAGELGMTYATWVGYSPDGRHAAVSGGTGAEWAFATGAKGQLAVVDLEKGDLVAPPVTGHDGAAWQLAYSPDGSRVLTSGLDGTAVLWDGSTGELLSKITLDGGAQLSAEFLEDGRSARILDWGSGAAYTWDLGTDRAVAFACRVAGRNFTRTEWQENFGDRPYVRVCDL